MELKFIFLAPLVVALLMAWLVTTSLKSGSIVRLNAASLFGYKGLTILSRRQNPGPFWFTVFLFGIVGILMLITSVSTFFGLTLANS